MREIATLVAPSRHGDDECGFGVNLWVDVGEKLTDDMIAIVADAFELTSFGRSREGLPQVGLADDSASVTDIIPVMRGGIGLVNAYNFTGCVELFLQPSEVLG